jgi:hypothetical protein
MANTATHTNIASSTYDNEMVDAEAKLGESKTGKF